MTAIRGYAALVLGQLDPDSPAARDALELCRTAEHATVLPRQLLAFARRQTARSRELDLNAVVQELRPLLQHVLGVERSLALPEEDDEIWVRVDPGQLEQALVNVTLNARDALEDAPGTVTIETRLVDLDDASASALSVTPGRYGSLSVSDTGVGMDEAPWPARWSRSSPRSRIAAAPAWACRRYRRRDAERRRHAHHEPDRRRHDRRDRAARRRDARRPRRWPDADPERATRRWSSWTTSRMCWP